MTTTPSTETIRGFTRSLHPVGLAVALLFFVWSMTPSLLPRVWPLQAVATGISLATGYGLGCLIAWAVRSCGVSPDHSARLRRIGWWSLAVTAAVTVPTFLVLGSWWQQITRDLAGVERIDRANYLLVLVLSLLVATVILAAARGIRRGTAALTRIAAPHVPAPLARVVALGLVLLIAVLSINGLVHRGVIGLADRTASAADHGTADGVRQPGAAERSGSPASAQAWESLGREGRTFVAGGPTAREIEEVTGRAARTPIRVYAGHDAAGTVEEAADLVVAELHRTGAFDRSVLAVATTTGRGWVNPRVAGALEYTTGGDSAIAAMQYSFLPSPLAFVGPIGSRPSARDAPCSRRWSAPSRTCPRPVAPHSSRSGRASAPSGGRPPSVVPGTWWPGPTARCGWARPTSHRSGPTSPPTATPGHRNACR